MYEVKEQLDPREELQRLEQMLWDPIIATDSLHSTLQRLVSLARDLELERDRLAWKNEQLTSQLADLNRSLELATRIDPVTRLANRRGLVERLVQEESRAQRHWRGFSLVLVELDDLDAVNRRGGFNAGDELLVEIACALHNSVRCEDRCGRWSGAQFLIMLPETSLEGAAIAAEKIVSSISNTEFCVNRTPLRASVTVALGEHRRDRNVHEFVAELEQAVRHSRQQTKQRFILV